MYFICITHFSVFTGHYKQEYWVSSNLFDFSKLVPGGIANVSKCVVGVRFLERGC